MKSAAALSAALLLSFSTTAAAVEASASDFARQKFDFLVVGGGTAGLVVAARLTEDPKITVGIIEAGAYRPGDPLIEVPQSAVAPSNPNGKPLIGNPDYDWKFESTPQPGLNGTSLPYSRGKVVGGSSAINFIVWQRGAKQEYDLWSTAFGNGPRWSFAGLLPYFKKIEAWTAPPKSPLTVAVDPSAGLAGAHGTKGPLAISYNNFQTSIEQPAAQAGINMGLKENFNPDLGDNFGFSNVARSVHPTKGIRTYAGNSYYTPNAQRKNLVLLTGAEVTQVVFATSRKGITATGVKYVAGNRTYTVNVAREVILSAGSIKTPQLLELSGVGNKQLLSKYKIPVVLNLPGVGENLQDHAFAGQDFRLKPGAVTLDNLNFNATFKAQQQELFNSSGKGLLSWTIPIAAPVTLQSLIGTTETNKLVGSLTQSLNKIKQTPLQKVQYKAQLALLKAGEVPQLNLIVYPTGNFVSAAAPNTSYVTMTIMEVHPYSRGSVHIGSAQPLAAPIINPDLLSIPYEAQILVKAQQFSERWMASQPVGKLVVGPNAPSAAVISDAEWESFVRTHTQTINHPIGTTAMAPRAMGGVVDPQLKVYGLQNVRIVDAGIFPLTISVPIQQTVYAVAELGADLIKETWGIKA